MLNQKLRHLLGMLAFYFIGYLIILPSILTKITLLLDPYAITFPPNVLLGGYLVYLILMIYFSRKQLIKGWYNFNKDLKKSLLLIFKSMGFILFVNFVLSLLVSLIFHTNGSMNQQSIESQSHLYPALLMFVTCVFAPIVEECVFRGSLLEYFQYRNWNKSGLIISSLIFGFIHVMDTLLIGGISELGYWFVYTMIGIVLGRSYQRSQSLIVCILIHALNNFIACILLMG